MRLQRLWQLKLYPVELHDNTNLKTFKARLGLLTSVDPCLLQPLMCRWQQRLGGHVHVYWIETSIKGIAASHGANRFRNLRSFTLCTRKGRPSLTTSATPPFWNSRGLHDRIRRVLSSDKTAETIPTRKRRRTANAGELNAEAGETVNSKWTTIRLHGGHTARNYEVLTWYRLPADIPRNRASVLFLFTLHDCPSENRRILALTCHHRTRETIEKCIIVPEDWRLRSWLFPEINSHPRT
jgi:hypothetical protein